MKALLYLTHLESQASSSHELCRRTRPWEARLLDHQESQRRCIGIGLWQYPINFVSEPLYRYFMDPTYSILKDEATTVITKLPVNYHPGSIIRDMLLGNARLKVKGIFWNLCCQAVVRPESFLLELARLSS
jgi:hypothetical protein